MKLQDKHIDFITNSLNFHGVTSESLREDLVDHICTYIEAKDTTNFDALYQEALQKFGGYASFKHLQLETSLQKFTKEKLVLNKLKIVFGCAMLLLLVLGMLFKIMHWPYASAFLTASILIFAFGIIPVLFYGSYKKSKYTLS